MDYKTSGVNIDAGNEAVQLIKDKVAKTHSKLVLNGIGNFGAFMALPKGLNEPILVSSTDGVGTKLKLAIETGIFNTIGIDLVAMSINDLICSGAKPLFFLDYIACNKLIPAQIDEIIDGIVKGCLESDCSLIGGEMAEMNDLYRKGDFDLAGFAVGVVEKSKIIDGSKIKPGDYVYALPSSGIHSNGYSLVRKVFTDSALKEFNISKEDLLKPTKLYAKDILDLINNNIKITGLCHITGGGLKENIKRILPNNVDVQIDEKNIKIIEIFKTIQKAGNITDAEMFRVFNMGVGMVIISRDVIRNSDIYKLGKVVFGEGNVYIG